MDHNDARVIKMFHVGVTHYHHNKEKTCNKLKLPVLSSEAQSLKSSLTTASLMEDGCLGHPGPSTPTTSPKIEYRPHDWKISATLQS